MLQKLGDATKTEERTRAKSLFDCWLIALQFRFCTKFSLSLLGTDSDSTQLYTKDTSRICGVY